MYIQPSTYRYYYYYYYYYWVPVLKYLMGRGSSRCIYLATRMYPNLGRVRERLLLDSSTGSTNPAGYFNTGKLVVGQGNLIVQTTIFLTC